MDSTADFSVPCLAVAGAPIGRNALEPSVCSLKAMSTSRGSTKHSDNPSSKRKVTSQFCFDASQGKAKLPITLRFINLPTFSYNFRYITKAANDACGIYSDPAKVRPARREGLVAVGSQAHDRRLAHQLGHRFFVLGTPNAAFRCWLHAPCAPSFKDETRQQPSPQPHPP